MINLNKTYLNFAILLLLTFVISHSASAAKMYKWVDQEGNVSYQDSPPPVGSKIIREEDIKVPTSPAQIPTQPTQAVIVYTVTNCEACEILLLRLKNWGVPVQQESLQNREVQARILQLSDSLQAPTLFIGDNLISNLDSANLSAELRKVGYQLGNTLNIEVREEDSAETQDDSEN